MAIKGQKAKQEVAQKILETFDKSFLYDKEIRIPCIEDGAEVQIKVTLVAAKANVNPDGEVVVPNAENAEGASKVESIEPAAYTETEKKNIATLLKELGL